MSTGGAASRRGSITVLALSALLLAAGVALAAAGSHTLASPLDVPWLALVPVYVLALHVTIDFEFRRDSLSIGLSPLAMVFGAVLLGPFAHLAARAIGTLADSLLWRREGWLKTSFNVGTGALEVGVVAGVLAVLPEGTGPSPILWLALFIALLVAETASNLAVVLLMRLLGSVQTAGQALQAVRAGAFTGGLFTALGIIGLSALWTDTSSVAIIGALALALAYAYRRHQRLSTQQRATERLYEFVKDLGPMDASSPQTQSTLEHIRGLLHAGQLRLTVLGDGGSAREVIVGEPGAGDQEGTLRPPDELDRMTTTLIGARGMIGSLAATGRLGPVGRFDMGDSRLLEAVGTALASALERGRLVADLERAATTDPLTGLPNLSESSRLINVLLARPDGALVAAIAVDSFREVNDTLGHQVGDGLLLEVARRLLLAIPEGVVGRIGGGRFLVAVPGAHFSSDPELLGLGLRAQVEGGAQLGAVGTHVRLSVGCVRGPEHGHDAESLVRRAETAMYSARHAHGGPVLWEPAYEVQGQRRLAVVTALREALASGALGIAFQPKIDASTGDVTGVEALARWTHPALGAITPDEFVPLAEASGLMGPLTATILRQALTACKGWHRRAGNVGVAVNVSAGTVLDPEFVTQVAALLTTTGVPAHLLTLELTEGVVVEDPLRAADRMQELRNLGVRLSVDDFGTGYSSLTYLKGLPVDEVKIDKGFVRSLVDDPADRAVVRAVVDIAHTLGMKVVAEGVEQEDQQQILRVLGVDELQGYFLARPMPSIDIGVWLRSREARLPR